MINFYIQYILTSNCSLDQKMLLLSRSPSNNPLINGNYFLIENSTPLSTTLYTADVDSSLLTIF